MIDTHSFKLTDKARQAILETSANDPDTIYLRVGIKGSGCKGFTPFFQFEVDAKDTDIVIQQDGAIVIIDPKSMKLLENATLDYRISLMKSQFILISEKITSTCGCGKSVSISK